MDQLIGAGQVQGSAQFRVEQGFLRNKLFGNNTIFECGICGKQYPISFLIASHIKRRSACTLSEKKDFGSIVMPMCTFGCDELYERGYIAVKDGIIVDLQVKPVTPKIKQYLSEIVNTPCKYWNTNTAAYFKWHLEKYYKPPTIG